MEKKSDLTELLILLVLRPAVNRPLLMHDMNVDEACVCKLLLVKQRCVQRTPVAPESLVDQYGPTPGRRILGQGAVIRGYGVYAVLELDPATRLKVPRVREPRP